MNWGDKRLPWRFWDKVVPEPMSGCWIWLGSTRGRMQHGHIWHLGKMHAVHRLSYSVLRHQIPDGLVIDHLCRVPCCVNPLHLEAVPQGENARRGIRNYKRQCARGHEMSPDNTYLFGANGQHRCRTCHRVDEKARRDRCKVEKIAAHEDP